jgi:hypothetical protein
MTAFAVQKPVGFLRITNRLVRLILKTVLHHLTAPRYLVINFNIPVTLNGRNTKTSFLCRFRLTQTSILGFLY